MSKLVDLRSRLSATEDPDEYFALEKQIQALLHAKPKPIRTRKHGAIDAGSMDEFVESTVVFRQEDDDTVCPSCDVPLVYRSLESTMLCTECGYTMNFFDYQAQHLTYDQEMNLDSSGTYSYKRISHFNEFISLLQAKETSRIPDEIIERIRSELRKERADFSTLQKAKVRDVLRKLRLSKYYDNVPQILRELTNRAPPEIPDELEARLRDMFTAILEPFERHCPSERKNFLSYSYVLYKICELLGEHELMGEFTLLKNREKLYSHDQIWKAICVDLGWEFIKTV